MLPPGTPLTQRRKRYCSRRHSRGCSHRRPMPSVVAWISRQPSCYQGPGQATRNLQSQLPSQPIRAQDRSCTVSSMWKDVRLPTHPPLSLSERSNLGVQMDYSVSGGALESSTITHCDLAAKPPRFRMSSPKLGPESIGWFFKFDGPVRLVRF